MWESARYGDRSESPTGVSSGSELDPLLGPRGGAASAGDASTPTGWLLRVGLGGYLATSLILVANLVTGIVIARALGPDGRGVTVVIVMVTQLAGFVAEIGASASLSYHAAREPERAARLFGTWVAILVPLGLLAIAVAELALPVLFASQEARTIWLGRLFLFNVLLVLWVGLVNGLLLGLHDFVAVNLLRIVQPVTAAVASLVLWRADLLTVEAALIVWIVTTLASVLAGTARILGRVGISGPDLDLARRTVPFGLRAHGDSLGGTVNMRLDLVILPAFVAATSLGLYSVAANVSLILMQFANALAVFVLPSTARDRPGAAATVVRSLQATVALGACGAGVLFLVAAPALELVYGESFRGAAETLRILLPGAVLYGAAAILAAGIHGAGRPLTATVNQLIGAALTILGLLVFARGGGIVAAAIVSTVAYSVVFAGDLVAYRRIAGLRWRELVRLRWPRPVQAAPAD
jgi:O-antigen/teichoic acid export membrane protein